MGAAVVIPVRENKEEIFEIAKKAVKVLEEENNIKVPDPEVVWTIAYKSLEELVKWVSEKADGDTNIINFFDLFDIGVTYRDSDEAEKGGNLTPFIQLNEEVVTNIKSGVKLIEKKENKDEMSSIFVKATRDAEELYKIGEAIADIIDTNNNIECSNGQSPLTITVVFVREVYNWLVKNHKTGTDLIINFCQLIDFGLVYLEEEVTPTIVAGQEFKLIIKNDDETEDDEDEE